MKRVYKIFGFISIFVILFACETTFSTQQDLYPVETIYPGVMVVKKTDGQFAKAQIPNTKMQPGEYKIILFPSSMELKSIYIVADTQGNMEVEYKLDKVYEIEPGHDGVVFGALKIINLSGTSLINVPVGFMP